MPVLDPLPTIFQDDFIFLVTFTASTVTNGTPDADVNLGGPTVNLLVGTKAWRGQPPLTTADIEDDQLGVLVNDSTALPTPLSMTGTFKIKVPFSRVPYTVFYTIIDYNLDGDETGRNESSVQFGSGGVGWETDDIAIPSAGDGSTAIGKMYYKIPWL